MTNLVLVDGSLTKSLGETQSKKLGHTYGRICNDKTYEGMTVILESQRIWCLLERPQKIVS